MYLFSTIKKLFAFTAVLFFFSVFAEAESTTVIIDNRDSKFTKSGKWSESAASDEYAGSSLFSKTRGSSAAWTPTLPKAGSYTVYAWYAGGSSYDRDTRADYTVKHAGGSKTIVINQNRGSGKWILLGRFSFNAGSSGTVTLKHNNNNKSEGTSADAVKFVRQQKVVPPKPVVPQGQVVHRGQVKDSSSGKGLTNVKVTVGGSTTTSNKNGFYTLSDLSEKEEAVVNFEKEGYLLGSARIQIKELSGDNTISPNYLEYSMHAYSNAWNNGRKWSYNSQNGAARGAAGAVEVPAGAIHKDAAGNVYKGTVSARWVFKDTMTAEGRDAFPGDFKGINANGVLVPFLPYGLASLELKNKSGTSLNVSEPITLVLPSLKGTRANIIPLWYYDYAQGLWMEEGYAERQSNGKYHADISHPGTWSLSQPIDEEVGIYRDRIISEDGSPMSDIRVYAVGKNWIGSDLSTDEDGIFEIEVMPNSSFRLKAYDYKNKFNANYNGIIKAIASGEIVENIN